MFFLFTILVLTAAIVYFYLLGIWFFALVPLLLLVGGLSYTILQSPLSFSKLQLSNYSLHIARSIILMAVFGILGFLGMQFPSSFLRILMGNILLWFMSYGIGYNDGKKIFQFGYYLTLFMFLIAGLIILPQTDISSFLIMILSLQVGLIGFLKYVFGIFIEVEDEYIYTLCISGLLLVCALLISGIPSLPAALVVISIVLFGIYGALWRFIQRKPIKNTNISIRRILAGERITSKAIFSNGFLTRMYTFVIDMPQIYRYFIEAINILVVIVLFIAFITNWSHINDLQHLLYWTVISLFVGNVLVLRKIEYTSFFQNLFLFLVIHFAVYISLFSYFESNIKSVVFWSVSWNVITSLGLFILPPKYQSLFGHKDYRYRIIASIMSFLVNIVLLLKSGLDGQLIFFLLLLYIGIEAMLVFYGIKHINKKFTRE